MRQRHAVVLFLAEGYSHAAIGAEMSLSSHQAAKLVRQALKTLAVQEWDPVEVDCFERMASGVSEDESPRQHFSALLEAIRNSQDATPRPATYDSNGRRVASRDPLVDVETAMRACSGIQAYPAKLQRNLTVGADCP